MTNPTPLSPAAQAIANAIEPLDWESGHCSYEDIRFISRQVAAAALRAAVHEASRSTKPHPAYTYTEPQLWAFFCGAGRMAEQFRAIAAELEGAQ